MSSSLRLLNRWAYDNKIILDFSKPDKSTDNAFIESFNDSFRDECLNVNWFLSLEARIQLFSTPQLIGRQDAGGVGKRAYVNTRILFF